MGKIRQILGLFATLLLFVFAQNAYSEGYTCVETYTACNAGYYMSSLGSQSYCDACPANSTTAQDNTSTTCTCGTGYVNSTNRSSTTVSTGETCGGIDLQFSCDNGVLKSGKTLPADMTLLYDQQYKIPYLSGDYCHKDGYHAAHSGYKNNAAWILTDNLGNTKLAGPSISIDYFRISDYNVSDIVAKPNWLQNTVFLELHVNGKRHWFSDDGTLTTAGYYALCRYDGTYTLPTTEIEGYTFSHWVSPMGKYYAEGASVPCTYAETGSYGGYIIEQGDTNLPGTYIMNDGKEISGSELDYKVFNAIYTPNVYTVKFDCGTGGGTAPSTREVAYDSTFTFPNNTCTNSNATFHSWKYIANGTEHEYYPGTSITWNYLDEEVTMVAQWDSCAACQPGNGATCSLNTSSGSCVYTTQCKPGYSAITGAGTATPQCYETKYTITYNIVDAVDSSVEVTLESPIGSTMYTVTQAVTLPTPSAIGYTFNGWYDNPSFTGTAVTSLPVGTTGNKTYYAKMIPEIYYLRYSCNGGSGSTPTPASIYYNRTVTVLDNMCQNETAIFTGWTLSGTGTKYQPDASFKWTYAGDQVLLAQWEDCQPCSTGADASCSLDTSSGKCVYTTSCNPGYTGLGGNGTATPSCSAKVYNITWNLDYGSVTEELPKTHTYGTRTDVDITPTKTGYTFAGWCTSNPASGSAECTPAITITATEIGDFEFWASWTVNTYTASYDCGTNGSNPPASQSVKYASGFTFGAACTPNTGYQFTGWYDGSTTRNPGAIITWGYSSNKTFVAQYALESDWTITYVENGGTISGTSTKSYNINSGTIQLPSIRRPGYNFGGWTTTDGVTNDVITSIRPGNPHTGNLTLYALWSQCNSTSAGTCSCSATEYPKYGVCTSCETQCSASFSGWSGTYNICTSGSENTACYKSCTVKCTAPLAPLSDRGTVSYDSASTKTGKTYYGTPNTCSESAYQCPGVTYSCYEGFTYVAAATTAADICTPNIYAITLDANGGTGGTTAVYEKYSVGFYSTSTATTELTKITVPTRANYAFGGYKDASGTIVIDANGTLPSNKTFTSDTILTAVWTQTFENCVAGKYLNNGNWVSCVEPYYCDSQGTVSSGGTGCNDTCPAGGFTSIDGSTAITDCHKIITDASKSFPNGTAKWDCYYTSGSGDNAVYNTNCTAVPQTCDAGYYYAGAGVIGCSPVGNGYYSADDELERQFCEGGDGSVAPRDSIDTCYVACDMTTSDVSHSTSVTSTNENARGMWVNGQYETCEYTLTCDTGYTPVTGANPSCKPIQYTVYLDKNGGTGDVAASVQCTFDSGSCTLPASRVLSRPGYLPLYKWCTDKAGNGTCYTAGSNVTGNLSADGSDVTLYAAWQPNIFEITISADGTDQASDPQTVYLKYATGWYLDGGEVQGITSLNTKPALAGYTFVGVNTEQDNSGVTIIDSTGKFLTTEEALTAVTDNAIVWPMWAAGTTHCDAGYYYPGTGNECSVCEINSWCPGGDFGTDTGNIGGLNSCPDGGFSAGGADATYEGVCYQTGLEYVADNGAGTQTCFWGSNAYDHDCNDIVITSCVAGHYYVSGFDCSVVEDNWYSPNGPITRTACPNNGLTNTATAASVNECYKTGLAYIPDSGNGSGTQTCTYTSGEGSSAKYETDCRDKVITKCNGGYWRESASAIDCVEVGQNYYSEQNDLDRNPCPQNGLTAVTTATASTFCYKTDTPYKADHGSGVQLCYYNDATSVYDTNCNTIIMQQCDAGYWWEKDTDEDCSPVGFGHYGPVAHETFTSHMVARSICPDAGQTATETSDASDDCYIDNVVCEIANGSGLQTCNYNANTMTYSNCTTCAVDGCGTGYYEQDGICVICPEGSVCDPTDPGWDGTPDTCNELTNGSHTMSAQGAGSIDDCYTYCSVADNASSMSGFDFWGEENDTCKIAQCNEGYYLSNGACVICPAGSVCDPDLPGGGGDDPQTCAELTGGTHTMSDKGAASVDMCYANCAMGNNASAMSGRDYYGIADTCQIASCASGYTLQNGACVICPAGSVCDPDLPGGGTDGAQTCAELTGGTHTKSDAGNSDVNMCYADCVADGDASAMSGRDYYGANIADTCEIAQCNEGYYLSNGACVICPAGSVCDPDLPGGGGDDPQTCAELTGGTHTMSDTGASKKEQCFATCPRKQVENGVGIATNETVFWPEQCDYDYQDPDGNPCEVINGVCVVTECRTGFEMKEDRCVACNRENALTYNNTGVCAVETCASGFHPNGSRCDANVVECSAPNAIAAEQVWNSKTKSYSICTITECAEEYHLMSNACVADIQDCVVENGIGIKEWNHTTKSWGTCQATVCDPGYSNDKFETNEHTKQCGQCKNKFSLLGEVAVSSYANGCEIASCMYQGEKYILENNECIPICSEEGHSDETGYMYWDNNSKKCIRECNDGYMSW